MQKNYIVNSFQLDKYQMEILNCNSNAIIIAGAGSGKTLTIIGKINYLIEQKNILPENILLISFTNSSVNDIKEKLKYNIDVLTFHKLAIKILLLNNIHYNYPENSLLNYTITEYLYNCNNIEQKYILKFLKLNISYSYFLKSRYFNNFIKFIENFILIYKTNNFNHLNIKDTYYTNLEKNILLIIFKIYKTYIIEKNSRQLLDFDDLIILATKYANSTILNYKYIFIDEFQDCSKIRLELIKRIHDHEKSIIIVVGDDWQSIYKFSGCDINLFLNFPRFFPQTKIIKLVNTYRNSQELITIASKFIQKNPNQIQKQLISTKTNASPFIFVPYTNKINALKRLLNNLINLNKDIMIISRNNNDIYNYIDNDFIYNNPFLYYKNTKIIYLSVHRSKGLESDYVIILNCNNETLGFPNKIENNKILDKLTKKEKTMYAEERRLFYVAITRCKTSTYILYAKNSPSIFVKELKKITKKHLKKINYFHSQK